MAPFPRSGVLIEGPHRVPFRGTDLASAQSSEFESSARSFALLANRFPLAAGQRPQKVVEGRIPAVAPMVLNAVADQPTAPLALGGASLVDEGDVRRRYRILHRHGFDCRKQMLWAASEQAGAGNRSEGHRQLQLRI